MLVLYLMLQSMNVRCWLTKILHNENKLAIKGNGGGLLCEMIMSLTSVKHAKIKQSFERTRRKNLILSF
jgi:hypothetical protein